MIYNACGRSGLLLPAVSLGLWHNFGGAPAKSQPRERPADAAVGGGALSERARDIVLTAFEAGVTYFDLANNYGPPPGAAEATFGDIVHAELRGHRDELIVSTKAGYDMWAGPYGSGGSRKHLLSSLDQSLRRLRLDYVDIFYSHRYDPSTPLEETLGALAQAVRQGKALYAGISNYPADKAREAFDGLKALGAPCVVNQWRYNLLQRRCESEALPVSAAHGVGVVAFSPLAQGLLTDRYLRGVPPDSRMALGGFLKPEVLTPALLDALRGLDDLARRAGTTLAAMALKWILRRPEVTSVIVGASSTQQLKETLQAADGGPDVDPQDIDDVLKDIRL